MELAAWERGRQARPSLRERARCVSCRRPDGAGILAWRDGWYAIPFPDGGRLAVFDPWGKPMLDKEGAARRLETPGWQPVTVQLNADGLCPRCAYCQKRNLPLGTSRQRPNGTPQRRY